MFVAPMQPPHKDGTLATDKVRKKIAKSLYADFWRQMLDDVTNVAGPSPAGDAISRALNNPTLLPDVKESTNFYVGESACDICDMPLVSEPLLRVQDVLDVVDARWHPMLMYYTWLIATSVFVYHHPQHLQQFRSIATGLQGCGDADGGPVVEDDGSLFHVYVDRLREAHAQHVKTKEAQLDAVFESTFKRDGAISQLAQEVSNELNLESCFKTPEDVVRLLDNKSADGILGQVVSKVGAKLHDKLANNEISQGALLEETLQMIGTLQKAFPMPVGPARSDAGMDALGGPLAHLMGILARQT